MESYSVQWRYSMNLYSLLCAIVPLSSERRRGVVCVRGDETRGVGSCDEHTCRQCHAILVHVTKCMGIRVLCRHLYAPKPLSQSTTPSDTHAFPPLHCQRTSSSSLATSCEYFKWLMWFCRNWEVMPTMASHSDSLLSCSRRQTQVSTTRGGEKARKQGWQLASD